MLRVNNRKDNELILVDSNIMLRTFAYSDKMLYLLSPIGNWDKGYEVKASRMEKLILDLSKTLENKVMVIEVELVSQPKSTITTVLKNIANSNYLTTKETTQTRENYTFTRNPKGSKLNLESDSDKACNNFVAKVFSKYPNVKSIHIEFAKK